MLTNAEKPFDDPYAQPILEDATYRCRICGFGASMDSFWGGPAYAHQRYYQIKCANPRCPMHEASNEPHAWADTPTEAIMKWNRRL